MITLTLEGAKLALLPLALFIVGMVVYSVFIFHFYRFIARKDIIYLDLNKYNTAKHPGIEKFLAILFYVARYLILFPVFLFAWIAVLVLLLAFLSKDQSLSTIMLVSVALVSAVRVTAYYNEDLSKDLAKMLPFALLGVFLVDASYLDFSGVLEIGKTVEANVQTAIYYFLFVVAVELILRVLSWFRPKVKTMEDVLEGQ